MSTVSQFIDDPRICHFEAVHLIMLSRVCSREIILLFNYGHLKLSVFTDTVWASSAEDTKSTFDYCTFVLDEVKDKQWELNLVLSQNTGRLWPMEFASFYGLRLYSRSGDVW